jgi:hypothetical protein
MRQTTRFLLHTAAFSTAFLVLSASAWAQVSGTVWRVLGNDTSAPDTAAAQLAVTSLANCTTLDQIGCQEGTFSSSDINFDSTGGQTETGPLTSAEELTGFLNFGSATLTDTIAASYLSEIMSGSQVANPSVGNNNQVGYCYDNTPTAETTGNGGNGATGCYSTVAEITGTATFTAGTAYNITHDDGAVLYVNGVQVLDAGGPTAAEVSTYTPASTLVNASFTIWYEGTNGNPEVLQANFGSTPEPGSLSVLLTMLGGIAGLAFIMKKKLA